MSAKYEPIVLSLGYNKTAQIQQTNKKILKQQNPEKIPEQQILFQPLPLTDIENRTLLPPGKPLVKRSKVNTSSVAPQLLYLPNILPSFGVKNITRNAMTAVKSAVGIGTHTVAEHISKRLHLFTSAWSGFPRLQILLRTGQL